MQNGVASHSQTSLALPETDLNTIPDPRSPSPSQVSRQSSNTSMRHPDLSNEVATLSTKLINAINLQTNLDDQLQSSRHELEAARDRIAQLEVALREHEAMVEKGLLVKRSDSERIQNGLRSKIDDEHKARSEAEREKKAMELELETLTSALFEEANTMVASARQEKEQSDRRADQLQAKLDETQALLASHQEQLSELKAVMQQLHTSVADNPPLSTTTSPSSPVLASSDRAPRSSDYLELHHTQLQQQQQQQRAGTPTQVSFPEAPLSYASLIQPIVRTDLAAYDDFLALLRTTQHTSSRATSGTFSGLNVLGLGTRDSIQSSVSVAAPQGPSNSSDPSSSPSLPGSFMGSAEPPSPTSTTNLRDTKFYKRVLTEDIEPTLRLDTAPGLSWLARRTVLNAMLTGNLVIEPLPSSTRLYGATFSCSMCGETRKDSDYVRRHRFKTSESDDAQTYPLCDYCLARVRATCDFMGFMRLAKKGHYRNETYPECRYAWEESVRLRERMFWSRLGGGVVPANPGLTTVPQSPALTDAGFDETRASRGGGVPMEEAIRLGRTLGGLRKRQSGSRTSISSLNGIVSNSASARQSSLPENTLPPSSSSGSRLNPARPSSSAAVVQRHHVQPETVPSKQESEVERAPAGEAITIAPSINTESVDKTEETVPASTDLGPSPAATPDLDAVDESSVEPDQAQPAVESLTSPVEHVETHVQAAPALPGPNGSLRQFPRNRSAVASPGSPSKPSSPASTYATPQPASTAMAPPPPPPPRMSKVASMAAKFQQHDASAADVKPTNAAAPVSTSRSPSRPRSKSRGPPGTTSNEQRQQSPFPQPQTQIHGAFG